MMLIGEKLPFISKVLFTERNAWYSSNGEEGGGGGEENPEQKLGPTSSATAQTATRNLGEKKSQTWLICLNFTSICLNVLSYIKKSVMIVLWRLDSCMKTERQISLTFIVSEVWKGSFSSYFLFSIITRGSIDGPTVCQLLMCFLLSHPLFVE